MPPAPLPIPETRYARSGDISIAYQVMGDGPIDLIMVPGLISHIEFAHELAGYTFPPADAQLLARLPDAPEFS